MHHRCITVMHNILHGAWLVKQVRLRESGGGGAKGVRQIAYCAVYGEERNGEWESSVVIEMPTLEKTPDPLFLPRHGLYLLRFATRG